MDKCNDLRDHNGLFISSPENWSEAIKRNTKISNAKLDSYGIYKEEYVVGGTKWAKSHDRDMGDVYPGVNMERVLLDLRLNKESQVELSA